VKRSSPYRAVNTLRLGYKNQSVMLYREIIAVCSEIRTEQINILCGQNVEFLDSKPAGTQETCWHTVNLLAHS